jgi:hypothetical protein
MVGWQFTRDQNGSGAVHVAQHKGRNGSLRVGLALLHPRSSAAFGRHGDHAFAGSVPPLRLIIIGIALGRLVFLACFPAEVRLIRFNNAPQQPVLVLHHETDALTEEPSGLLADAEVFAQLGRGDALAAGSDQIERGEPRPHRRMGTLQCSDRSGRIARTISEPAVCTRAFHLR